MQASCSAKTVAIRATSATASKTVRAAPVAAFAKKDMAAVAASFTTLVASNPALALVDTRLNGDGTGKVLGADNSLEIFLLVGTFTTIWALYFLSTKELGGDSTDESGLSL